LAMEALKKDVPRLYQKLQNRAVFAGKAQDESIIRVAGKRIIAGPGNNGSIIVDTSEAPKRLSDILKKHDFPESQIVNWQQKFEFLQEEDLLELPSGDKFIKRKTPPLHPELSLQRLDERLLVLIAFEFLGLLIGDQILYNEFDPIRQYLQGIRMPEGISVEHLSGGKYESLHALLIEPRDGYTQVKVRFFRWLTFRVTFHNIDYQGKDCVYFEDLKTPKSLFASTFENAVNGKWFIPSYK
jgi:hypothetical protein